MISYSMLRDFFTRTIPWVRTSRFKRQVALASKSYRTPVIMNFICEFLAWKYPEYQLFRRGKYQYPVFAVKSLEAQSRLPDSVLIGAFSDPPITPREYEGDPTYRKIITTLGILPEPEKNRPTYAMRNLSHGDDIHLNCYLGSYFDTLDTCDSLEWEILLAADSHGIFERSEDNFREFDDLLRLRNVLHRYVKDPVVSGAGRCAGIAISTLLAYRDGNVYRMLLRPRAATRSVAMHKSLLHVIPSCMFQIVSGDHEREFSVGHNFRREYLEELFDIPEELHQVSAERVEEHPNVLFLKELLASGRAEFVFTGVAVSLLNLRPEICTLLVIHDEAWHKDQSAPTVTGRLPLKLNLEFAIPAELGEEERNMNLDFTITPDGNPTGHNSILPTNTCPTGAVAFWLGLDSLRARLAYRGTRL